MKYFELAPFDLHLNAETIITALRNGDSAEGNDVNTQGADEGHAHMTATQMTATHVAALTSSGKTASSAWASRSALRGDRHHRLGLLRLQSHRADAVAMAEYRKLAEEAVANQQELRTSSPAERARPGGRAAHARRGMGAPRPGGPAGAPTPSVPRRLPWPPPSRPVSRSSTRSRCGSPCPAERLARTTSAGTSSSRLAAVRHRLHRDGDRRRIPDHAGRYPAAGRGGEIAAPLPSAPGCGVLADRPGAASR